MPDVGAAPRQQGQVEIAVAELSKRSTHLKDAMNRLEERLQPILREPDGKEGSTKAEICRTVGLAERITEIIVTYKIVADRLESIMDRCEL